MQQVSIITAADVSRLEDLIDAMLEGLEGDGRTILDVQVVPDHDEGYLVVIRYDIPQQEG